MRGGWWGRCGLGAKVKVLFVKLFPSNKKSTVSLQRQVAKRERKSSFKNCQDWRFSVTVCVEKGHKVDEAENPSAAHRAPALLFWLQRQGPRAAASAVPGHPGCSR